MNVTEDILWVLDLVKSRLEYISRTARDTDVPRTTPEEMKIVLESICSNADDTLYYVEEQMLKMVRE